MSPRALLLAALLVPTLAGCSSGLAKREVVVAFAPDTPESARLAARSACSAIPNTSPVPLPSASAPAVSRRNNVRFRVDDASDRELDVLYQCLRRQPGVIGVTPPTLL